MCEIYTNLLLNTIHPILCYLVVLSGWVDIYSGHDFVAWFQNNLHASRIHKYSIEICQPNWFLLFSEIPLLPSGLIQFYIFSRLGKARGCSTTIVANNYLNHLFCRWWSSLFTKLAPRLIQSISCDDCVSVCFWMISKIINEFQNLTIGSKVQQFCCIKQIGCFAKI